MRKLRAGGIFLLFIAILLFLFYGSILLPLTAGIIGIAFIASGREPALVETESPFPTEPEPPPTVQKETIIEREVVKIRCNYCGTLVDFARNSRCPSCGAPV